MKKRKRNSDPLPVDIIVEILSRSSNKSVATFGLASKYCASIVSRQDFTELFLTRSITRPRGPRLLFSVKNRHGWCFFSSHQPQNPDTKPSLVVKADFLKGFKEFVCPEICGLVSSLLLFTSIRTSKMQVICNPSTGQYRRLRQRKKINFTRPLLGYDPIGKQYKVLNICNPPYGSPYEEEGIRSLPTTTGELSWRKFWFLTHYPISEGICINGVLYYVAIVTGGMNKMIACFNVRHENLEFLKAHAITGNESSSSNKLINYKGKLGVISWYWYGFDGRPRSALKLCLWILKDDKKQEWLQHNYNFPVNVIVEGDISVVGVIAATGEIVFSMDYTFKRFFVFYFNPERNTFKKVGIQGFEESENQARVHTFVDYAEDFNFIR
ncbi:hypothetical protein EUTSA_v10015343mg [Eutrema salsugineum]|uniref:F-box associated beta-propeller type 3 domain-containing protein n=1 Tax=Eutrema salsugineum TaxID=72664 RepID=V4LTP5_EUTSA|nr:putative F-box protein At5g52620 [Eutrema salsugineum]ESQ43253.1 hypothetical protein EUTSA_v10015343mg [Eutrema salsugineum]